MGFREENARPFMEMINARRDSLMVKQLTKQCTQANLMKLASSKENVERLLAELKSCVSAKADLEMYIKRVSDFLDIQVNKEAEITGLKRKNIDTLQQFVNSEMSKIAFPDSGLRLSELMCVYKPELLRDRRSRLRIFELDRDEGVLFIFEEDPLSQTFKGGFCITDKSFCYIKNGVRNKSHIGFVSDISAPRLTNTISVSVVSGKLSFSITESYAFRNSLAGALMRIIPVVKGSAKSLSDAEKSVNERYSEKIRECFANTPIPNDKLLVGAEPERKRMETGETEKTGTAAHAVSAEANPAAAQTIRKEPEREQEEARRSEKAGIAAPVTTAELVNLLPNLIRKYGLQNVYNAVGTQIFANKLPKARAAYAAYDPSETPLMLNDQTILGSAKEGFVLTDKAVYIRNNSGRARLPLNTIESVYDVYDSTFKLHNTYIKFKEPDVSKQRMYLSYTSHDFAANKYVDFWTEILALVNAGGAVDKPVVALPQNNVPDQPQAAAQSGNADFWLCSCGKTNSGKFCSGCGSKRESGTPLWKCSCGSYNKGKFCPKCGAKKIE